MASYADRFNCLLNMQAVNKGNLFTIEDTTEAGLFSAW
jgi:hypothetical protein